MVDHYASLSSQLVQLLITCNRNTDAVDIAIQAANSGKIVLNEPLRHLFQRLAEDGEVQLLDRLSDSLLIVTTRHNLKFGDENLKAYEKFGKRDEFYKIILEKCEKATGDSFENIEDRIAVLNLLKLLRNKSIQLNECKY